MTEDNVIVTPGYGYSEEVLEQLADANILIAPTTLDLPQVAEFLVKYRKMRNNTPSAITVLVQGDGGQTSAAMSIVDIIQLDGDINTILIGDAWSSHAFIFLAGSNRRIFPRARLGLHSVQVRYHEDTRHNQEGILSLSLDTLDTNRMLFDILESTCGGKRTWEEWQHQINLVGTGFYMMEAKTLVGLGMAQAIEPKEFRNILGVL